MDTKMNEIMESGELYVCTAPQLVHKQLELMETIYDYNATRPLEQKKRSELLQKMFRRCGSDAYVETPIHASWGINTSIGARFYANFNLVLIDDGPITIGDDVLIGPNVTLATAQHPICPELRAQGTQYNKPITIGNRVWLASGIIVLPGVTIGDDCVIGAGSVVTKSIPPRSVAVGNPCKVIREITEKDHEVYDKNRPINPEWYKQK